MTRSKRKRRESKLFYLYISPWLIGLFAFTFIPMVFSLFASFTDIRMIGATTRMPTLVGLQNYVDIITKDSDFHQAILNTFVYAFSKVILTVVLALFVAVLLNHKLIGRKTFRTMIYLPAVIPVVSVALLWKLIFTGDNMNIANYFLSYLGLQPVNFFGDGRIAMTTLIFIGVWSGLGPTMLILLAAIQGVREDLIDASKLDGANSWQVFRHIVIPSISSTIFFVTLTGVIGGLQAYAEIKLLTNGGPGNSTLTTNLLIVNNAFNNLGRKTLGYASAQAWLVFLFIMILTIIFIKASKKMVYYQEGGE